MDAVASRDALVDYLHFAAQLGVHLSRLGAEIVWWASDDVGFVELDDAYTSGSSMLPQKKNPDAAELARAKAPRLTADLAGLLGVLAGLPLAYNKDLQEDKRFLFDAIDTVELLLPAAAGHGGHGATSARSAWPPPAEGGFLAATDLADHLVSAGWPFRRAHEAVGRLVRGLRGARRRARRRPGPPTWPPPASTGVDAAPADGRGLGRGQGGARRHGARARCWRRSRRPGPWWRRGRRRGGPLVHLGFGKYARADRIYALSPHRGRRAAARAAAPWCGSRASPSPWWPAAPRRPSWPTWARAGPSCPATSRPRRIGLLGEIAEQVRAVGPLLRREIRAEAALDLDDLESRARALLERTAGASDPEALF